MRDPRTLMTDCNASESVWLRDLRRLPAGTNGRAPEGATEAKAWLITPGISLFFRIHARARETLRSNAIGCNPVSPHR